MNLDDLKDRLREQFQNLWAQIQESAAWTQLTEKYQNLSPNGQKATLAGAVLFSVLILLAVPYVYFSASQEAVVEYEEKRNLIRELFQVSRATSTIQTSTDSSISGESLRARAESELNSANIPQEQRVSVGPYDNRGPQSSPAIPKNVIQEGVQVSLSKLNLNQVVDIGHKLQSIHPSAKMVGLEVRANKEDGHYFDVVYKLVSFTLPVEPEPKAPAPKGKRPTRPAAGSGDEE